VPARDALFATLNPVSRRLRFPREREIIITDTVGFIRSLPRELLAAFRTTLEELDEADLLLHVLDASRPDVDQLYQTVTGQLKQLGLGDKQELVVLNKTDQCDPAVVEGLQRQYGGVPVCALDRSTFGPLIDALEGRLWAPADDAAAC
jgi:GTP-binding protein HflX